MPKVRTADPRVVITMHDKIVDTDDGNKRYDASRKVVAMSLSVARLQQMVKEETKQQKRNAERVAACPGAWDVGERPSRPMAYIEYPPVPRVNVQRRSEVEFSTQEERVEPRYISRQRRRDELATVGGSTAKATPYQPLGAMDAISGDHVAPSFFTNAVVRSGGIKVIEPQTNGERASAQPEERHTRLTPNVKAVGSVYKGEYAYYSVIVPPGRSLEVACTALTGDPDLYICTSGMTMYPTHQKHSWRAMNMGDDMVRIDANDPDAKPGKYYIGVLGMKDTFFQIVASLDLRIPVAPPPLPRAHDRGTALSTRSWARATCGCAPWRAATPCCAGCPRSWGRQGTLRRRCERREMKQRRSWSVR